MLARISEQANAAAVDVPRPDTPPLRAPTPGSIALGVLLPIPGALVVASRADVRNSVASSSVHGHRNSSAFSLSGASRSSMDTDTARPSIESSRSRRYYRAELEPHSETEDDHVDENLPLPSKKPEKRFTTLLKRVSSAMRRTTGAREKRFFPVTWGRSR
ncbi:hypothetical protein EXIGLDRAFT_702062 [Exidia glandulosa HHB12029]|uniref:Uncharacterized protein n=1 Tax=Exidia glandulosa HHB12029 TaxID=1314781 RepID=A0A165CQX1_EXIGL|nr:hypothetical protein EXIGLDRAFT_702062 [Exidia glandulosa HHB12029]